MTRLEILAIKSMLAHCSIAHHENEDGVMFAALLLPKPFQRFAFAIQGRAGAIALYSRDSQGIIEAHGATDWQSIDRAIDYYTGGHPDDPEPEQLKGWPDEAVIWCGQIGFSIRTHHGDSR